jgi:hypothetical protein
MTEQEWLTCTDPKPMLRSVLGTDHPRIQAVEAFPACRGSDRKLRLFACACYHRISHLLPDALARAAVEVAEQFADGMATPEELQQAEARVLGPLEALEGRWGASQGAERAALMPTHEALALASVATWASAQKAAYYASSNAYLAAASITDAGSGRSGGGSHASQVVEEKVQTDILRCIFGGLFRPVGIDPAVLAWNDGTVQMLARRIYEERAFHLLPVLSDALLDAGCDDEGLIRHCREAGPHARGCWCLDLISGKS